MGWHDGRECEKLFLAAARHAPWMEMSEGYRASSVWARAVCPDPSFCVSVGALLWQIWLELTVNDTFSQMRVLVEEGGAFMNVTDRWGNTPLVEANRSGAKPCASYLERRLSTEQKGAIHVDCLYKSLASAGRAAPDPVLKCSWKSMMTWRFAIPNLPYEMLASLGMTLQEFLIGTASPLGS